VNGCESTHSAPPTAAGSSPLAADPNSATNRNHSGNNEVKQPKKPHRAAFTSNGSSKVSVRTGFRRQENIGAVRRSNGCVSNFRFLTQLGLSPVADFDLRSTSANALKYSKDKSQDSLAENRQIGNSFGQLAEIERNGFPCLPARAPAAQPLQPVGEITFPL
jgi:hypothetical protein